jgi:ABC-type transporter Mla subunit MlaD
VSEQLDQLIEQLEQTASSLRAGELDPDQAASAVEHAAALAAQVGAQLDQLAREPDEPLPGQEELL